MEFYASLSENGKDWGPHFDFEVYIPLEDDVAWFPAVVSAIGIRDFSS